MNVVASSLRIKQPTMAFLTALAADARAGRAPETLRRRCIRVGEQLGFIFGNGLMANFLGEYYGTGKYGPARAAWLLIRAFASAMVRGPFVRKLFKRFEGRCGWTARRWNEPPSWDWRPGRCSEVGLGFKLIHRAAEDLDRFGLLAIHAPPLSLLPDFWSVHAGRGVSPRRAFSSTAATLEIIPQNGAGMPYTIDGDLYQSPGAVTISIGPPIDFVKPAGALIVANRGDTMRNQA